MSKPPKSPPRFVPTLTEVVQEPGAIPVHERAPWPAAAAPLQPSEHTMAVQSSAFRAPAWLASGGGVLPSAMAPAPPWGATAAAAAVVAAPELPEGFEELLIHRVMQRVDVGLDQRLREAIATVVQEQTRSVLPRLREEVESVVRQVVYEAVADELVASSTAQAFKS